MANSGSAILALDLGVNLGACGGTGEVPALLASSKLAWLSRTRSVKGEKVKESRPWGWRWRSAREQLNAWLWEVRPRLVLVEGPGYFKSKSAYRVHYGLHAMVQELALDFGAAWEELAPSELKKWATGSGNAGKVPMIEAANALALAHGGPEAANEHEADARLLYAWARARV